jgi:DNA polymerase-3 subunit epsilon
MPHHTPANSLVVLDFETTGLSPNNGDRIIEIGAVKITQGVITDRFQTLANPGIRINSFIADYTGITNAMIKNAPSCEEATAQLCAFLGNSPVLAHNAAFDKRFLTSECQHIGVTPTEHFLCSMLLAKRIYPTAGSYKLSALLEHAKIQSTGSFHRALYDSEMTAKLWLAMLAELNLSHGLAHFTVAQAAKLSKTARSAVPVLLKNWAA